MPFLHPRQLFHEKRLFMFFHFPKTSPISLSSAAIFLPAYLKKSSSICFFLSSKARILQSQNHFLLRFSSSVFPSFPASPLSHLQDLPLFKIAVTDRPQYRCSSAICTFCSISAIVRATFKNLLWHDLCRKIHFLLKHPVKAFFSFLLLSHNIFNTRRIQIPTYSDNRYPDNAPLWICPASSTLFRITSWNLHLLLHQISVHRILIYSYGLHTDIHAVKDRGGWSGSDNGVSPPRTWDTFLKIGKNSTLAELVALTGSFTCRGHYSSHYTLKNMTSLLLHRLPARFRSIFSFKLLPVHPKTGHLYVQDRVSPAAEILASPPGQKAIWYGAVHGMDGFWSAAADWTVNLPHCKWKILPDSLHCQGRQNTRHNICKQRFPRLRAVPIIRKWCLPPGRNLCGPPHCTLTVNILQNQEFLFLLYYTSFWFSGDCAFLEMVQCFF